MEVSRIGCTDDDDVCNICESPTEKIAGEKLPKRNACSLGLRLLSPVGSYRERRYTIMAVYLACLPLVIEVLRGYNVQS